jgi:Uma2 family endonuclease
MWHMTTLAAPAPARVTREQYFALVDQGVLGPDDDVELLEGVIVAMAPEGPRHAEVWDLVGDALRAALGDRARVKAGHPFDASAWSVPQPDIAVVPGKPRDYLDHHPSSAHLLVEVAASSLPQDRLTKASIYAAAGIPEYWIINLRQEHVEVHRSPDPAVRRYATVEIARRGSRLTLVAFPDVSVSVDDLLP